MDGFKTAGDYGVRQQLNFTQATSRELLKLTLFCDDTIFQSFFAIINRFNHAPRCAGIQYIHYL